MSDFLNILLQIFYDKIFFAGLLVSALASLLGVFVILRRFALVGDAMSHVALPGLALALAFHFNPFFGAILFLVAAVLLIIQLEKITSISTETIVGILFMSSLALGSLFIPSFELAESLFGDISGVTFNDVLIIIAGCSLAALVLFFNFPKFVKISISSELARLEKINIGRQNFVFLLLLALVIALGIKMIGTLLIGALIILPPVIARNFSRDLRTMALLSGVCGILMFGLGFLSAFAFNANVGAAVTLSGSAMFVLSLVFAKGR